MPKMPKIKERFKAQGTGCKVVPKIKNDKPNKLNGCWRIELQGPFSPATCVAETRNRCAMEKWRTI